MGNDVMKKNSKIKYGNKNLLPEKIDPKDERITISIKMEGDLLDALKHKAKELNRPYQTLMKEMLRETLELKVSDMDDHIRKIVRQELSKIA
jgi:predicted DNA binding CopG/RHH family protein